MAISLASKGTNYFFKLFTMFNVLTQEMLYLANILFEEVNLCRTITTKAQSTEIYCVCERFRYNKHEVDELIGSLLKWYPMKINKLFDDGVVQTGHYSLIGTVNEIFAYRLITSVNFLLFRFYNAQYTKKHEEVHKYINKLVKHYVEYFCEYFDIKMLTDKLI